MECLFIFDEIVVFKDIIKIIVFVNLKILILKGIAWQEYICFTKIILFSKYSMEKIFSISTIQKNIFQKKAIIVVQSMVRTMN